MFSLRPLHFFIGSGFLTEPEAHLLSSQLRQAQKEIPYCCLLRSGIIGPHACLDFICILKIQTPAVMLT